MPTASGSRRLYREVCQDARAQLEDIDAVITWPQQPRKSYRYRRLVVPFEGERNSTMLLSATLMDPDINLRVKPG